MKLAIDASNIRTGGGLTHLIEILNNGNANQYGIEKVIVWSNNNTLSKLPDKDWLIKKTHPWLNKSAFTSFIFQIVLLSKYLKKDKTDLLFVPGGTYLGKFKNVVVMSQNMLPFEIEERNRFPNWQKRFRFKVLNITQAHTFKKAKGLLFLTEYAQKEIQKQLSLNNKQQIISHGINFNFVQEPKTQKRIEEFSFDKPFKLLYVSIVTAYKHQWNVAKAVLKLRNEGIPIVLQLVGPSTTESLEKLNEVLQKDKFKCIEYRGIVPYEVLSTVYKNADGFIFASSCENQPIILIEAMTAGLPIACSDMGPMPEVLQESGFYFNPLNVDSIYNTLKYFLNNHHIRQSKSKIAFDKALEYTWKDCADNTFKFLSNFK